VSSKQLLRRIGLGILTLWLVSLVVFAAVIALPGDAATAILGKTATPAASPPCASSCISTSRS